MREVLTLGTKLELIRSAERRWFTLPAVNCYTRSKPLVESSSHYSSRQACSSQTRNESNFRWLKNLNWWSWGWCAGPSLSLSLLIKTAPLWRKTVRERDSAALCQERKKRNLFSQHIHISTLKQKDKLWDCGMSSANPFENTQTKSHPNNPVLMLMKSLGTRRLTTAKY